MSTFTVHGICLLFGKHLMEMGFIKRSLIESRRNKICMNKVVNRAMVTFYQFKLPFNSHLRDYTTQFPRKKPFKLQTQENFNKFTSEFDEDEEEIKKKRDTSWRRMKISLICLSSAFGLAGVYIIYFLGSPKKDDFGNIIEDEFSALPLPQQFFKRMLREIDYLNKMIRQPASNKLLPDKLPPPYLQPKYTLVLEITDLLVHPDWTYQTGWRFKKRPGVDKFLEMVTFPMFELVVFSVEQGVTSYPLIDALDPNGYIVFRLGKESTQFFDGYYVKNLDCLNRDISKVIIVDWNEKSVKFHRDNAVIIPRWTGQDDDTTLVDLAVFLRTIAASDTDDVRDILSFYSRYDNPVEAFRENQIKFLEFIEETEEKERKKESSLASVWSNKFLKALYRPDLK